MRILRKWTFLGAALGVVIGMTANIALAALTNSQNTSATVSMAQSEDFTLYICEPGGVAGPECGADDSGPDEIIFEGDENAAPGSTRIWDVRLRNVGTSVAWDLWSFDVAIAAVDPDDDCPIAPELTKVMVLGKVTTAGGNQDTLTNLSYDCGNDNHHGLAGAVAGAIELPFWDAWGSGSPGWVVHVAPGDYEDLRLRVLFPDQGQGNECLGSEWSISIKWNVTAHN